MAMRNVYLECHNIVDNALHALSLNERTIAESHGIRSTEERSLKISGIDGC